MKESDKKKRILEINAQIQDLIKEQQELVSSIFIPLKDDNLSLTVEEITKGAKNAYRIQQVCRCRYIYTVRDLLKFGADGLSKTRNMGLGSLNELSEIMAKLGYEFKIVDKNIYRKI